MINPQVFGVLENSTEGKDLQAVNPVENKDGFEARSKLVHRNVEAADEATLIRVLRASLVLCALAF